MREMTKDTLYVILGIIFALVISALLLTYIFSHVTPPKLVIKLEQDKPVIQEDNQKRDHFRAL